MPQKVSFMLASGAALIGTLCFVAGQPGFALLGERIAGSVGVGFFLVSGLFWAAFGFGAAKER